MAVASNVFLLLRIVEYRHKHVGKRDACLKLISNDTKIFIEKVNLKVFRRPLLIPF